MEEHFLVVGSSDYIDLKSLHRAHQYLHDHALDLLLIGVMNREMYEGKPVRQVLCDASTPQSQDSSQRRAQLWSRPLCGLHDGLRSRGLPGLYWLPDLYKAFFRALCDVQATLSEPLYSIPIATLELTSRKEYSVGFWPAVVVTRIDHLQFGADSAEQSPNWWVVKQRTDRGLSNHLFLSVLSGSLQLTHAAFETLVTSQTVSMARGRSQYIYSNFLYTLLSQVIDYVRYGATNAALRYNSQELQEIVAFGVRLDTVDLGLPVNQRNLLSRWLQQFEALGDYSNQGKIDELLAPASVILALLDTRPGMERWIAQLG